MADDELNRLRTSWVSNAEAWTDAVRNRRIESRRLATDAAVVAAVLERSPRTCLDVGCGEGWLARAVFEKGLDVVGIDSTPALIAAARGAGGARFEEISYASLIDDPTLLAGPFDAAVANFALFEERIDALLRSLHARIAEHGRLIIQTVHPAVVDPPYADGWRIDTFSAIGENCEPMPWFFRTLSSWVAVFNATGFRLAEVREPLHPETDRPLSILFTCSAS